MRAYLRNNGRHFNRKACEWAVKNMRKYNETTRRLERIEPLDKTAVDELLKNNGITLDYARGYDYVYVANMCKADFWGSSIKDEESMARYVKDTVDDVDQKDGFIFNRFYADCCHGGLPIPWDDVL